MYHPQLGDLLDLARAFPETPIVLNHVGGAIGLGRYKGKRDAVFADWSARIRELAACPNVHVKLGGLGMRMFGFDVHEGELPPSSEQLAAAWRPYIETCIAAFGPEPRDVRKQLPRRQGLLRLRRLLECLQATGPRGDCEREGRPVPRDCIRILPSWYLRGTVASPRSDCLKLSVEMGVPKMTRLQPAWRSLLFVPVTSERFLSKAHTPRRRRHHSRPRGLDPARDKAAARAALPAAVPRAAQGGADVVVRINRPLDLAVADIAASVMPGVAALMLPKVMGPEHVRLLAELVTDREAALGMPIGHTRFLALIESPAALPHLYAIAAEPRMAGMSVGGEDMATELGAIPSADSMYVFAMQGLAACRTAGILPMGSMGQLANIDDLDSYRAGLKRGKALGFTTASCIHPAHVPIINEEYGASAAELDRARRLLAAFDAAGPTGPARWLSKAAWSTCPSSFARSGCCSAPNPGRAPRRPLNANCPGTLQCQWHEASATWTG